MPRTRKPQSLLIQMVDLCLVELTNWRWSWRSMVLLSIITPLCSMLALYVFVRDAGQDMLAYILSGNLVLGLVFGNLGQATSHLVYMRFMGSLDYFATLPVRRSVLVLAVVLAFFALSLPALAVTVALGALLLDVPIALSPAILIVAPLCAISLSGIGALLGVSARTPEEASSLSLLLTWVMTGMGPVIIPPTRLPDFVLALGYLNPAVYAASALRQTLLGPLIGRLALDLAILIGFTMVSLWLVGRKMDWRQK